MAKQKTYKKPSKDKRRKKERDIIRREYQDNLPEQDKNPNHLEDFEALLSKMVNTKIEEEPTGKKTRKRGKNSRRDKTKVVKKGDV